MRLLVLAGELPMHDRSAGAFRLAHMLRILAAEHEVYFHPSGLVWQLQHFGSDVVMPYKEELASCGVRFSDGTWGEVSRWLRTARFKVALFEYYRAAKRSVVEEIRFWQPGARVVIDTVDVAFNRLAAKARVSGDTSDLRLAREVKAEELAAYARADVVIAVSESDAAILRRENPKLRIEVVPLIFDIRPFAKERSRRPVRDLVFIADFRHEANVDAIVQFHKDVLPLVVKEAPDVRLRIVGHSPPQEVQALAGPNVEVVGFVRDLAAVYASTDIAIAPMRYGGGLKGKIAEAMAFGIPVVTNSASLEGFNVTPGKQAIVGDDPAALARGVLRLLGDPALYESVREEGWRFVQANYSRDAVALRLRQVIARSCEAPVQRMSIGKRIARKYHAAFERRVLWKVRQFRSKS